MNERTKKPLGYFLAVLTVFIWGVTFISTKYLLRTFSALEILFIRYFLAYIGLWVMHPKSEKFIARDNILFAFAGLCGVVLYQFSENVAIHFTNASNVSIIISVSPLFTAVLAQLFLKEKHLSLSFVIGFIISITGIVFVCFNGNAALKFNPKGDFLALAAGFSWACYSLFLSVLNRRKYNLIAMTRRIFFFAILFMIPLLVAGGVISNSDININEGIKASMSISLSGEFNAMRFSNLINVLNLLFLSFIASGFCFTAWNTACEIVGTVKTTCGIYLIPVVTVVFAYIVLDEKITWLGAVGAFVTIAGLFISTLRKKNIN